MGKRQQEDDTDTNSPATGKPLAHGFAKVGETLTRLKSRVWALSVAGERRRSRRRHRPDIHPANGNVQWKWKNAWRRRRRRRGLMGARTVGSISGCRIPTTTGPRSPGPRWCVALHPQHRQRDLHHRGQRVQSERGVPLGVDAGAVDRQQAAGGGRLRRRRGQLRPQPRQHAGFVQAVLQKPLHRQVRRRPNTEALLAPANYCTDCWGNARSLAGWISGRTPTPTGST